MLIYSKHLQYQRIMPRLPRLYTLLVVLLGVTHLVWLGKMGIDIWEGEVVYTGLLKQGYEVSLSSSMVRAGE